MKELIKSIKILKKNEDLQFHCETYDCSSCQQATCNKNCKDNPAGNTSASEIEEILF
jgi:hypothetical protein